MGFTEEDISGELHLPEVYFETDILEASTTKERVSLNIKASDSLYSLDRINIFLNDVPIYGINGISLKGKNLKNYTDSIPLNLIYGRNKIQVSALNEKGVESFKEIKEIFCNKPYVKPDLYIATIGVSRYKDSDYNLLYADKDADDLISLYKKNKKLFNKVHVLNLNNEMAVSENIVKINDFYSKSHVDDIVVLFIAGHGMRDDKDGENRLAGGIAFYKYFLIKISPQTPYFHFIIKLFNILFFM
ncbi:unnamed protein product [marine sediment metagenome]|uniref:Uncharacterized protein n=1 Tax=marine sediment metagenome TaxID=412755 RepID=X1A764_9ZZZZ